MTITEQDVDRARARGNVYALLALCFVALRDATVRDWLSGDLAGAFRESLEALPGADALAAAVDRLDREGRARGGAHLPDAHRALELERQRLFVGPAKLPAPPYESVYRTDVPAEERGLLMGEAAADVRRRYRAAGLDVASDSRELPDHIGAELEFMHFLCGREAEALEGGDAALAADWRSRRQAFLRDHLSVWAADFCRDVEAATTEPFYAAVAALCREFVDWDRRARGEGAGA